MKKYIFSCICILCLSLSGCDYLDTEPGDAISSDRFWETSNAATLSNIAIFIILNSSRDMVILCLGILEI